VKRHWRLFRLSWTGTIVWCAHPGMSGQQQEGLSTHPIHHGSSAPALYSCHKPATQQAQSVWCFECVLTICLHHHLVVVVAESMHACMVVVGSSSRQVCCLCRVVGPCPRPCVLGRIEIAAVAVTWLSTCVNARTQCAVLCRALL
jgi:hypothetical protein